MVARIQMSESRDSVKRKIPKPGTPPGRGVLWLDEHLKPETLKEFLDTHFEAIRLFQSAILIRRPIAFVGLFLAINLHFYAYMILEPPAYCAVLAPLIYIFALRTFWDQVWPPIYDSLFSDNVSDGDETETNRIRTSEELVQLITTVASPIVTMVKVYDKIIHVQKPELLYVRFVLWVCAFVLTASVDFFWIIWAAINVVILLPGALYYPPVYEALDIAKATLVSLLQAFVPM